MATGYYCDSCKCECFELHRQCRGCGSPCHPSDTKDDDPAPPTEGDAVQRAIRTVELNTPITGESVKAAYVGQAAVTLVARVRELEARVRELEAADPARGMPPYKCGCPAVRSDLVNAFCNVHHKTFPLSAERQAEIDAAIAKRRRT